MAPRTATKQHPQLGQGQLTLVEHALCPLDPGASLSENLIHTAQYHFTDKHRQLRTAQARVYCPLGLSANDELFLWGLLSITLAQPEVEPELNATPHYCLRQLGLIDVAGRRGGRQYLQFASALKRLAAVVYQNDQFYDPLRCEHRQVSFGFLSYSLPLDPESSRAWRIAWNPLFFEMVLAASGGLRFDLALYRTLEPASRRLFLLLSKIFRRRATTPRFDLHNLAVDVLGFSSTITAADLKKKVRKCIDRLAELGIVAQAHFEKQRAGRYRILLKRGSYYTTSSATPPRHPTDSALFDPLSSLKLDPTLIPRLIQQYPARMLREWVDITLAARERFGESFFKKSAEAYFMDNIKHAVQSARTPPDWWLELRKAEREREVLCDRPQRSRTPKPQAPESHSSAAQAQIASLVPRLAAQFRSAGQSPHEAQGNAKRFAEHHVRQQSARQSPESGLAPLLHDLLSRITTS